MPRTVEIAGALDSDGRALGAVSLLAALTVAPGNRLRIQDALHELNVTPDQLNELVALLDAVSDARTGARIALSFDRDELVLEGNAGTFDPLRFTADEALAITQVLDRFNLLPDLKQRVHRALDPVIDQHELVQLDGDPLFGGFYQVIAEALAIGARMHITYRSYEDSEPCQRTIDPGFITVVGDAAHLEAWDITQDAQRTYRLDRITSAELTDDSVIPHPFEHTKLGERLRTAGTDVLMRFASRARFDACTWEGLERANAQEDADGSVTAPVHCTSEPWLFSQVLAAGGELEILEPEDFRAKLVSYAQDLL